MSNAHRIANQPKHKEFIKRNSDDLWIGTAYEGYKNLSNTNKGLFGENIVSELLQELSYTIKDRVNPEHDRIINDIKTEIKFSLAHSDYKKRIIKKNTFIINHVAILKDWERLIMLCVNPSDDIFFWILKNDLKYLVANDLYFKHQQGGKNSTNDDYMCSGNNLIELSKSKYAKKMTDW